MPSLQACSGLASQVQRFVQAQPGPSFRRPASTERRPWPRLWPDQRACLERQHDRLELLLHTLIHQHHEHLGGSPAWSGEQATTCEHACRILVWRLTLHLRLEERWLAGWGCLCPGHRQAHRDASAAALEGLLRCRGDRGHRLAWLKALRSWFIAHRDGADARAYSLAHLASQP